MNIIGIFSPGKSGGVLFHLARRAQKKKKGEGGHLPPHCLVGELAHPIELLLHFVFSVFERLLGGDIPHYFSQRDGPGSTEAQRRIRSHMFPSPFMAGSRQRKHPTITSFFLQ